MFLWTVKITGPTNSAYECCEIYAMLYLPTGYPFKPPFFKFLTQVIHPNTSPGFVFIKRCIYWSPTSTIRDVLSDIVELLIEPDCDTPESLEIVRLFKSNFEEFKRRAKDATENK